MKPAQFKNACDAIVQAVADIKDAVIDIPKPAPMFCCRWGQCTSLAKAESQPCVGCASYEPDEPEQPASSGVCYNHGCASQHDDKCFDDGSHFDPLRCTSRVVAKPAPEKSAVDRLREAGASVSTVRGLAALNIPRALIQGELVWLCIDALTLPRAEAALRASKGGPCNWDDCSRCAATIPTIKSQLADRDAEIERLTADVVKLEADVDEGDKRDMRNRDEIERLSGEIAEAFDIINASWTQRCHKADVWLDRNKEA